MKRSFTFSVMILLFAGISIVILGYASSRRYFHPKNIEYSIPDKSDPRFGEREKQTISVIWTPQEVEGHQCYQVLRHEAEGNMDGGIVVATIEAGAQENTSGYFRFTEPAVDGKEYAYAVRSVGAERTRIISSVTLHN